MSSSTSIGRGPASGGNENHDGDPRNTTFGETVAHEPPAGSIVTGEADAAKATEQGQPGNAASAADGNTAADANRRPA